MANPFLRAQTLPRRNPRPSWAARPSRARSPRKPRPRSKASQRAPPQRSSCARGAHDRVRAVFDIAFSEIVVIAVVALVVIGPERLPKVARTLGHMFGRLQRYVNEVKADINREMELDELRKLQSEVQSAARDIEQSVNNAAHEMETGVRSVR